MGLRTAPCHLSNISFSGSRVRPVSDHWWPKREECVNEGKPQPQLIVLKCTCCRANSFFFFGGGGYEHKVLNFFFRWVGFSWINYTGPHHHERDTLACFLQQCKL